MPAGPHPSAETVPAAPLSAAPAAAAPAAAATASGAAPVHRWRWLILAVVLVAEVMDLLDATVVTIAAPSITSDLGGGSTTIQWLGAAYTLPFAVFLITGGRLGDLFGRRRMFLIGAAGFTVASAACACAPTPGVLLATRAIQGAFGALLIPQGFGIVKEVFPPDKIAGAFAAFGPVIGLSAVGGPILAGVLIHADLFGSGWRLIFLVNVPLGIAAVAGAAALMPPGRRTAAGLDLPGTLIVSLAALALVFPLVEGRALGWPLWVIGLIAAGVAGFVIFAWYERRAANRGTALVEPSLLANGTYLNGLLVALAFFSAFSGLMLVVSLFGQIGLGFSPLRTGFALTPLALGIAAAAPVSSGLADRHGRVVIQAGLVLAAGGLAGLAVSVAHAGSATTVWWLGPGLLLTGIGAGLVLPPLFQVILAGVAEAEVGSASGVLNAVQQLASAVGFAVVGSIYFALLDRGGRSPGAASTAMSRTALITIGLVVVALALTVRLPRRARSEP